MNNEMTFFFSAQKDTLSFFHGNKKPLKKEITIEISLKNNGKVVFKSGDNNLNSDKTNWKWPFDKDGLIPFIYGYV